MATTITVSADPGLLLARNPSSLPININATFDGRLLTSSATDLDGRNYAYTMSYNPAGTLLQEFRTFGGTTEVKTYTYDDDNNLTGESAWIEV